MDQKRTLPPGEMMLKTREAAYRLGVSESYLNKARVSGNGPVAHVYGRRVTYRLADLEAYAAAHRVEPTVIPAPSLDDNGGRRA